MPLLLVAVGTFAGTYGTIIGAGGGFIMVPILLFLFPDVGAAEISAISLFAVMFNGVSATYAYGRLKRIDFKTALVFTLATVPGSIAGVFVVSHLHRQVFMAVFGAVLAVIGVYLIVFSRRRFSGPAPARQGGRTLTDAQNKTYSYSVNYPLGVSIAFAVGFLSGMLGIGGGLLMVPAMVLLLLIPFPVAVGTSQAIILGTALVGTMTHFANGTLWGQWERAPMLALGTVVGAQLGARIAPRLRDTMVARLLSLALVGVGARLLFEAFKG